MAAMATTTTTTPDITCNKLFGLVYKMTDGSDQWRIRIPISECKDIKLPASYNGTLDREQYKLYSILSEFNIDYKTIDEKYYQYLIKSDSEYLYCYARTENCVRAGLVHYIRMNGKDINKLTFTRSIEYNIYKKNNIEKLRTCRISSLYTEKEEVDRWGPNTWYPGCDEGDY